MSVRFLAVSILVLGSCSGAASPQPGDPLDSLDRHISLHATGNVVQLIRELGNQVDLPLVLLPSWRSPETLQARFTLDLENVRISSAVRWLARISSLSAVYRDGAIVFGSEPQVHAPVERSYDVRALLAEPPHQVAPDLQFSPWGRPGFEFDGGKSVIVTPDELFVIADAFPDDSLREMIKDAAGHGTWEQIPYLAEVNLDQQLRVVHQPAVQGCVEEFLKALASHVGGTFAISVEVGPAVNSEAAGQPLGSKETAILEARLREHPTTRLEVSAVPGRSARSITRREGRRGAASITVEAATLTATASAAAPGLIRVDLRLALGSSATLSPLESSLMKLQTRLLVPAGGGVLLNLAGGRQGLIRASARSLSPLEPQMLTPRLSRDLTLLERLRAAPPVDARFLDAPVEEFAAWFRRTVGVNVVVSIPAPERLTIVARGIAPLKLLELAVGSCRLDWAPLDEAVYITPWARLERERTPVALIPVDDLVDSAANVRGPGREDETSTWTGEDLANLIKNSIEPEHWEEADGRSIRFDDHRRLLMIRNSPSILAKILNYVADLRRATPGMLSLSARLLSLPRAALANWNPGDLVESSVVEGFERAGRVVERLDWCAMDGQVTCPTWERSREVEEEAPISGAPAPTEKRTTSWLELQPRRTDGGIRVMLRFSDERFAEGKPFVRSASGQMAATLPPGKWGLNVWSEGEDRVGVLAVRAERTR